MDPMGYEVCHKKKSANPPDFRDGPQGSGATAAVEDRHL